MTAVSLLVLFCWPVVNSLKDQSANTILSDGGVTRCKNQAPWWSCLIQKSNFKQRRRWRAYLLCKCSPNHISCNWTFNKIWTAEILQSSDLARHRSAGILTCRREDWEPNIKSKELKQSWVMVTPHPIWSALGSDHRQCLNYQIVLGLVQYRDLNKQDPKVLCIGSMAVIFQAWMLSEI